MYYVRLAVDAVAVLIVAGWFVRRFKTYRYYSQLYQGMKKGMR